MSLTELCSFWYGLKDLFTLHKLAATSCPWLLKLMKSQAVEAHGFKSGTAILTCFSLSLLPSFFAFLVYFFFSCWTFSRLHFWWETFLGKLKIRILEVDERKGRLVVEQDFHGNFQVDVTCMVFAFFCSVLDWIVLILVWFERSLHSAQVSGHKLSVTVKTDDVTSSRRTWTNISGYGRLRGKWFNKSFI